MSQNITDISCLKPNPDKKLLIDTDYGKFARFPVRTHLVVKGDDLKEIMDKYVRPYLQPGDSIFLSEKMVAISQGRAFPISEIKPSWLARFLVRFVYKSPYGIGLGSPYTMELALRDIGVPLILFGAFCAAITKPFGIRGVFYRVVGNRARAIDGPGEYVIPPYNKYAKLAPLKPNKVAKELSEYLGCDVVIVDANDLGVEILGKSRRDIELRMVRQIFKDNPLCQSAEQTPIAIVRKMPDDAVEPVFDDKPAAGDFGASVPQT
ncbi:MAG TPA: F420-0--gamma-glutamyl ligase [Clostridiales bacterium]|nr:F420-0--gamma-glutamyl ligase [Clostridiales bacterium]